MPDSYSRRGFCRLAAGAGLAGWGMRALPATTPGDHIPGRFTDITTAAGIHFLHHASHTPLKYLPETMGSGVALFDYDNDG
ncbi:MAG TPA: hypothetical protein VF283_05060, partial [Bryobacteraceae bacterium]